MILEPLNNLAFFVHPVNGRQYRYMAVSEVERMVKVLTETIDEGLPLVSVESGSYPLAKMVAERQGLKHIRLKVPRSVTPGLGMYMAFLLSTNELHERLDSEEITAIDAESGRLDLDPLPEGCTRQEALAHWSHTFERTDPPTIDEALETYQSARTHPAVSALNMILCRTWLACLLDSPIYLLDEYVTSGTVLSVVNQVLAFFNEDFSYRLLTYSCNVAAVDAPSFLFSSVLYGSPWDQRDVYPFENRLDLLGFRYVETVDGLLRIELPRAVKDGSDYGSCSISFLERLRRRLIASETPQRMAAALDTPQLQAYDAIEHAMRFSLFLLEERVVERDLWEQLFEMYAPSWSPLPVELHLEFTGAYHSADWLPVTIAPLQEDYRCVADRLAEETTIALARCHNEYWDRYEQTRIG